MFKGIQFPWKKKKESEKSESDSINQGMNLTPEMQEYFKALKRKDPEAMKKYLILNADKCPSKNSYCLKEVFCPDCPLANGGLAVQSGRKDW